MWILAVKHMMPPNIGSQFSLSIAMPGYNQSLRISNGLLAKKEHPYPPSIPGIYPVFCQKNVFQWSDGPQNHSDLVILNGKSLEIHGPRQLTTA
jgi:hypothetical protein